MKIIALQAENLKRLTAVEIRPDGNLVEITGKNGQGKTSVLDAIWWALAGTRNVQAQPIRRGAERAVIRLDLGDFIVTRTFKLKEEGGYTTSLTVERDDGNQLKSPQAVLDALIGDISFDPLSFTRMTPKEQFDALKRFVRGVDFDAIDAANRSDFEKRTVENRKAEDLRARASGITLPPGAVPAAVDVAALEAELGKAADHNSEIERRKGRRDAAQARVAAIDEEIARLQQERATLKEQLDAAGPLPEPIKVEEVQQKLATARSGNEVAAKAAEKARLNAEAQTHEDASAALTKAMKKRDEEKAAAVAKSEMPVPGLGFGDGEVLLNGVPFDQASDAEQLRASIAIAGQLNPELRVIRVRDGSLLDDDAMLQLAKYAEDHDLQIWVERVDSSGRIGFVLEDGHLKGAAVEAEQEEAV